MIEAHDLTRRFGAALAVDRLSLRVPDGTIAALLGPNGAGKTTTVRMLAGLLAPSAGAATVAGYDVRRDPTGVRARVGLVTDVPGLYEQMNLPAYLDFFGDIYGLPKAARRQRIADLIAFFDLADHQRERMVGFSKGMKQKVALARALLHEPDVLFLDEPTSGLDPLAARAVRDLIVSLKGSHRAIVLCTHDLDEAERLADQVVIIRQGHVVAAGPPASLRASASHDTLVRVELAAPCPPALTVLGAVAGISVPAWEHGTLPVLTYRTEQPRDINPAALAALVAAGARVVAVTCTTQTLEDVYASAMSEHPDGLVAIGGRR
ncbi:MAG: ABC transporter ATP-binding protein [Thermomicrobiales bacterium]